MNKKIYVLFFLCFIIVSVYAEEIKTEKTKLTLVAQNDTSTMLVDSDIKELYFEKSKLEKIIGLEKLSELETIVFDMTAFITDFSFLEDIPQIKKAVFIFTDPKSWQFLEKMTGLEILVIRSSYMNQNFNLNLSNNSKIQYIEISYCNLTEYPQFENIPKSLDYLNLSFNKFNTTPKRNEDEHFTIILYGNNIAEKSFVQGVTYESPTKILPSKYLISNVSH